MNVEHMKNYRLRFSIKGFVAFSLIMIPNIIWMIIPPANDILAGNSSVRSILNIIMNASQWLMVGLLIALTNKTGSNRIQSKLIIIAAAFCLASYYILWGFYFIGLVNPWFLVGMAVFPSIYFIFVELWLRNFIAIIPSVVFGITHIAITCFNFLKL